MAVEIDLKFTRNHPMRSPDWRWQRAWNLKEQTRLARTDDNDRYVLAAIRYMRMTPQDRPAHQCWAEQLAKKEENAFVKAEVEARLLAGQSDEEIASRLGCDKAIIEYYEAWFYNVRDRLDRPSYLWHRLVLPLLDGEDTSKEGVWKLFAFLGGAEVLDELIYEGRSRRREDFWNEDLLRTLTRRLAVWSHLTSPEKAAEVLSRLLRLQMSSVKSAGREQHNEKWLESVPWNWSSGIFPTIGGAFVLPQERTRINDQLTSYLETARFEPR